MDEQLTREQFEKVLERVIATAPDGLNEAQFDALVDQEAAKAEAALKPRPVATGGGRGTALNLQRSESWLKDNAPTIGATIAAMSAPASGGLSIPIGMALAGAGGGAGSLLRGDDMDTALGQAKTQGLTEGVGRAVGIPLKLFGRSTMKQAIPKNILDEFDDVNMAKEALHHGAVMGSETSAKRIGGLSHVANQNRAQLAKTVPDMPVQNLFKADSEIGKLYNKALIAGAPDDAIHIATHATDAAANLGGPGASMSGPRTLARKDWLQPKAKAALNATTPRNAALDPQLYNAERAGLTSHLRETPGMEEALNKSQALLALDRAGQATKNSGLVHRARQGGAASAALSPFGLSLTAHGADALGSPNVTPNIARLLLQLLGGGSMEQNEQQ